MFARIAARAWAPAIGTAGTLIAAAAWLSKATDGDARALAQTAETSFNSRVRLALNEYRAKEQEMRTRWERDEEERWRFLPARAWPAAAVAVASHDASCDGVVEAARQSRDSSHQIGVDKLADACFRNLCAAKR